MAYLIPGDVRVEFDNTPGLDVPAPDNGELRVQQADGVLITRRSDGLKRLTDLRPMAEQLQSGPLADVITLIQQALANTLPLSGGDVNGPLSARGVTAKSGGSTGGWVALGKGADYALNGSGVIIDQTGSFVRIYEGAAPFRGAVLDIASCGTQSFLWHDGNLDGAVPSDAEFLAGTSTTKRPTVKQIADRTQILALEGADLRLLGFIGDGASHPLIERFATLGAAQAVYPRATALTEEIDGVALQRAVDLAVAVGRDVCITLPRGAIARTSKPVDSTAAKSCTVTSPGFAKIICVGTATGCWIHGTAANRASGAFTWRGVDLDTASSAATTLLTTFFGIAGVGRGQCLTLQKARFDRGTRGWLLGNMPRGATIDDLQVFGPDNAMQAGGGIEVVVDNNAPYGSFAYSWKDVIVANYTWGWDFQCTQALEGVLFSGCHGYNGWGFCRVNNTRAGFYHSLLWEFNGCDWEGLGFALDMYRCKGVRVRGGFWIQTTNNAGRPLPAGVVTDGAELRHVNFRDVNDFMLDGMQFAAGGPSDGSTRTNFVLVNTDAACFAGEIIGSSLFTDHATATCAFRLSGSSTGAIVERRTKLLNWWGEPPVVVYAGTGDQPYQISDADAASKGGTVSDKGVYRFTGVGVFTSDTQGRITIPLPRRSGGVLPFFHDVPRAMVVSGNANGAAPAVSVVSVTGLAIVVAVANNAANVTTAVYWNAEGT